jgi:hypothetical protein
MSPSIRFFRAAEAFPSLLLGAMRALRLLKRIALGVIGAIVGVYLVFAIGLTVLEWVVRENPKVDESLLAHSTAPHTITHFGQGAASFSVAWS